MSRIRFGRKLLFIGIIGAGSLLVVATAGEAMVRLFAPPFVVVAPAIKEPDPARGYRLIPGVVGRGFLAGEYDVTYSINSLGFRDHEYPDRAPGRQILILGDSFTFGSGVEIEQTFPKALERRLRAAGGPGGAVDVVNMGVYGYSSEQSLLLLRDIGGRFHPELVVYAIVGAYDFPRNTDGIAPMPAASLPPWLRNGISRSWFAQYLMKVVAQMAISPEWTAPAVLSDRAPELFAKGIRGSREALEGMRSWAGQRNARFLLVYVPLCYEINRREWEVRGVADHFDERSVGGGPTMPSLLTAGIAREAGLDLIDLLPALRERYRSGLYYVKDRHLTPEGNDLVAEILSDEIGRRLEPVVAGR